MAALLARAFSPHAHVETEERFVGRVRELARVKGLVANPGLHLVIYGERGTGKTSLALTGTSALAPGRRVVVVCGKRHFFNDICREIALQLVEVFPQRLVYDASVGTIRCDGATFPTATIGRDVIRVLLPKGEEPFVVVIDEVDRIQHADTQAELAEFAKYLSTVLPNVHLVMVGVSKTANLLLAGHESNVRTLHQLPLDRMPDAEMLLVLRRGLDVLSLGIDPTTRDELVTLADRSPYYLHLIARAAAEKALLRGASTLEAVDLQVGLEAVAEDADAELRNEYDVAVASGK
ncbi:MAG: ATP-binding protein, partial [Polyangiales bacterium]